MSGISKRVSGSWVSGDYGIMKTATETITTLPADIYADGTNATVGLKGNMSQTGTPTPQNPIQPQETGERTENSFNINGTYTTQGSNSVSNNQINARCAGSNESYMWFDDTILSGTYKLSLQFNGGLRNVRILCSKAFSGGTYNSYYGGWYAALNNGEITITVSEDFNIGFNFIGDAAATGAVYYIMLSTDTNADYEPYGYKIPISSASTTTPVYLGEVESTRKIKKYEITGLEGWIVRSGTPENIFFCERQGVNFINNAAICSHYPNQDSGSFADLQDKHFFVRVASSNDKTYLAIRDSSYPSTNEGVEQLKNYLQQQYANGTPVTVWYVLATETTGIVNEPIRKIGDYADEVSGITIPTITGKDTFDVETTLKPSEVELAYTGWHDATVKEWDGSDWQ